MKNIYYYLTTLLCLTFGVSCNSDSSKDIFPNDYHKILYINDDGEQTLEFSVVQTEAEKDVVVIKAGSDPSLTAQVKLTVITQEEIDQAYDQQDIMNYSAIPSDCFAVTEDPILFAKGEVSKSIPVKFDISKIKALIRDDASKKYVLGLELVSVDNSNLNIDKKSVLYILNIKIQTVKWDIAPMITKELLVSQETASVELKATVNKNTTNFTCGLDLSTASTLVDEYNAAHQTEYTLLPPEAYTFNGFQFTIGTDVSAPTLTLAVPQVDPSKEYLLPLKFSKTSNGNNVSDEMRYLEVYITSVYEGVETEKTGWKILLCNSDHVMNQDWGEPSVSCILDGKINGHWTSAYASYASDYKADGKEQGDDYSYDNKMHNGNTIDYTYAFKKYRDRAIIVVDMGKVRTIHSIGVQQRQNPEYADFKSGEFYISNDPYFLFTPGDVADYNVIGKNKWNLVYTWTGVEQILSKQWRALSGRDIAKGKTTGRYLKISTSDGWRHYDDTKFMTSFAELLIKEVSTVDGEPVK